ncbi:hypothetical protein [Hamadaea tsunoensis]|uniref:hypothetical protein n=1 Tax=Hamadaea tsunoensis TaxID=53368 RepID=UPI00042A80C1|nr:hypothetical protein [Hamadaea tsunoensis]
MTGQTEQHLRDLFHSDAARAPGPGRLAEGARQRVRRRRVRLLSTGGAAVLVAGSIAGYAATHRSTPQPPAAMAAATPTPTPDGGRYGPLPDSPAQSCAVQYSAKTLADRAFSFDGTVVRIGPPLSNRTGVALPLEGVTFEVHRWFRGGSADTVTVDLMPAPPALEGVPAYGPGTRLLVSGQPRWGGTPTQAAIAWGCGFTRYYDPATAAQWAEATS